MEMGLQVAIWLGAGLSLLLLLGRRRKRRALR
jgi:LPXTG-motif cell wall-anchored protein